MARAQVVIVGCGYGGLFAARAPVRAPADVLLIDRNNYQLFQPRRGSRVITRVVPLPEPHP